MRSRFNFSKAEKVGVAVLGLTILFLVVLLNIPRHSFVPNLLVEDTTEIEYIYPEKRTVNKTFSETSKKSTNNLKVQYKVFNPNDYLKRDWIAIGFSKKQANVILNYKKQIDGFHSKEDVASCFVISDKKFRELEPFLKFDELEKTKISEEENLSASSIIELNRADQELLETVNGIGPYFAKKIVEKGEKLGGYANVIQLKEIYGMTDESYDRIVNHLTADASLINPINLIEANFDQLKKHPYLNWKQSQILVSLPNKEISKSFWKLLEQDEAFSESDINRIKPYLK